MRPLEVSRIVECDEMDLVPPVQFLQRAERPNLSAAISGMQEKWTDPKDLHYRKMAPNHNRMNERTCFLGRSAPPWYTPFE